MKREIQTFWTTFSVLISLGIVSVVAMVYIVFGFISSVGR